MIRALWERIPPERQRFVRFAIVGASGVVVNLSGDSVTLNTDLTDPNQRTNVDRKTVKSMEVSKVSPMPPMLLAMLKKEEILDLVAYVLSGGNPEDERFKK